MAVICLLLLSALLHSHSAGVHVGIVNGTIATPHSKPFMVSVQFKGEHICGGFLVSEYFVMSAAHCIARGLNVTDLTAVIGAHNLDANDYDRIPVQKYFIHPDFMGGDNPNNDIMLLKLGKSSTNSRNSGNISIPKTYEYVKQSTVCTIAGWGNMKTNGPSSTVLMEAKIRVLSKHTCDEQWINRTKILCAGGLNGGFCTGDSGGPLVCNNTAVGIAAFYDKDNCDVPKKPNAYTNISEFLDWIREIIGNI